MHTSSHQHFPWQRDRGHSIHLEETSRLVVHGGVEVGEDEGAGKGVGVRG